MGANASTLLDRNARGVTLKVDCEGPGASSRTRRAGRSGTSSPGARSTRSHRPPASRQVDFKLDYSGGWGTYKKDVWKTLRNTCGPYTGPPLAWRVTRLHGQGRHQLGAPVVAADAPELRRRAECEAGRLGAPALALDGAAARADGQHELGLREVRPPLRDVPLQRARPSTASSRPPAATRSTRFGRNLYVDTFNSAYGPGWKRENSFLMHKGTGHVLLRLLSPRQPPDRQGRALPGHDHRPRRDARRDVAGQRPRARTTPRSTSSSPTSSARPSLRIASARPSERTLPLRIDPHDRRGRVRHGRGDRRHRAGVGRGARGARRRLGRALLARGAAGDDGHELARVVALHARRARAVADAGRRSTTRSCGGCSSAIAPTCR